MTQRSATDWFWEITHSCSFFNNLEWPQVFFGQFNLASAFFGKFSSATDFFWLSSAAFLLENSDQPQLFSWQLSSAVNISRQFSSAAAFFWIIQLQSFSGQFSSLTVFFWTRIYAHYVPKNSSPWRGHVNERWPCGHASMCIPLGGPSGTNPES